MGKNKVKGNTLVFYHSTQRIFARSQAKISFPTNVGYAGLLPSGLPVI
ncbi:MAG TPA: hypothetical protein VIH20_02845 [Candidatus Subteraquimicrobiales bacterium]